jgi:hypothetical protein
MPIFLYKQLNSKSTILTWIEKIYYILEVNSYFHIKSQIYNEFVGLAESKPIRPVQNFSTANRQNKVF